MNSFVQCKTHRGWFRRNAINVKHYCVSSNLKEIHIINFEKFSTCKTSTSFDYIKYKNVQCYKFEL